MSRWIMERLAAPELLALRARGGDWGGGPLASTPLPDGWSLLIVRPDGHWRLGVTGEDPNPARADVLVLVRSQPVLVPVLVSDAATRDHNVRAEVELLLTPPRGAEGLAAFREVLLNDETLTLVQLTEQVLRAGAPAIVRQFLAERSAADVVHGDVRAALHAALADGLKRFLFLTGFVLAGVGAVDISSPALRRAERVQQSTDERVRELEARQVVESAALTAARRRLSGLSDLFDKLRATTAGTQFTTAGSHEAPAGASSPGWHELLPALTPGERGRLLENLWRLTPDREQTTAVVAVAGRECAWFDPREPDEVARRVELPDELGPLRCVRAASGGGLLVGAATGVWWLRDDGTVIAAFRTPARANVQTGFNAAALVGSHLVATHSQLGAWAWQLERPDAGWPLLQPIGGVPARVRAALPDGGGRVYVATDDFVRAFDPAGDVTWESGPTDGSVHCLALLDGVLYAGTSRGALLRCEPRLPDAWVLVHRSHTAIETLQARRWDDLVELVIPAGPDGVLGVYAGERIVAGLLRCVAGVRRAWASDDLLVALTTARERLIVLGGETPVQSGLDVPVARLLGRAVDDVCLVTRPVNAAGASDERTTT